MMVDESIAVAPSEDQGNVSVETEPVETTETVTTEAPAEKVETETPAEPVVELFELPDGTKVDAATLAKEWKENFYPDYTKKSQALAAKEKTEITKPADPLADPSYQPQTYAELAEKIEAQTLAKIEAKEQAKVAQDKAREDMVEAQIVAVKKIDPSVNENDLFVHANTYRAKGIIFNDLTAVYNHRKELSDLAKNVQKTTAQNIAKRADPVSVSPGATGARPEPSQFATAQDYLRAVKASGK